MMDRKREKVTPSFIQPKLGEFVLIQEAGTNYQVPASFQLH